MIRLAVRCRPDLAEQVLAELVELAPGGVEEERGETYVEYAIYGPPGELPAVPALEAAAGEGLVEISSSEIPDDWADRWRDFHEPIRVGRLCVRPTWLEPDPQAEIDVAVDPGQAFGPGSRHDEDVPGAPAGARRGRGGLRAAQRPRHRVGSSRHRCGEARLRAGDRVRSRKAGRRSPIQTLTPTTWTSNPSGRSPQGLPELAHLVANLTSPLLESIAERIPHPPPVAVLSGLLVSEADRVARPLRPAG